MPVEVKCAWCDGAFEVEPARAERSENHFCDHECMANFQSKTVMTFCVECFKLAYVPSRMAKQDGGYVCEPCRGLGD